MSNDTPLNDSNIQDIIKKEARELGDDTDFGEVRDFRRTCNNTKRICSQRQILLS
jgi:hypothetical protein